ncbi:MAG: hypothetical protein ACXV4C_09425 [Halobacteriota archaeon]
MTGKAERTSSCRAKCRMQSSHFLRFTIRVSLEERRHLAQFIMNTSFDEQREKGHAARNAKLNSR